MRTTRRWRGDAAQTDAQAAKLEKRARLLREEPTNEELDALLRGRARPEHRVDDATPPPFSPIDVPRPSIPRAGEARCLRQVEEAAARRHGRVRCGELVMTTSTSRTSRASLPMKRPAF